MLQRQNIAIRTQLLKQYYQSGKKKEWPKERSRIDITLRKGIKCLKTVRLIYLTRVKIFAVEDEGLGRRAFIFMQWNEIKNHLRICRGKRCNCASFILLRMGLRIARDLQRPGPGALAWWIRENMNCRKLVVRRLRAVHYVFNVAAARTVRTIFLPSRRHYARRAPGIYHFYRREDDF